MCDDEGTANDTVIRMGQDEELQDREVHKPMQHDRKPSLREGNVQQEVSENTSGQGVMCQINKSCRIFCLSVTLPTP